MQRYNVGVTYSEGAWRTSNGKRKRTTSLASKKFKLLSDVQVMSHEQLIHGIEERLKQLNLAKHPVVVECEVLFSELVTGNSSTMTNEQLVYGNRSMRGAV